MNYDGQEQTDISLILGKFDTFAKTFQESIDRNDKNNAERMKSFSEVIELKLDAFKNETVLNAKNNMNWGHSEVDKNKEDHTNIENFVKRVNGETDDKFTIVNGRLEKLETKTDKNQDDIDELKNAPVRKNAAIVTNAKSIIFKVIIGLTAAGVGAMIWNIIIKNLPIGG